MDTNDIYVRPQVAWSKLRAARADGVNVYIYGATGFGKTELINRVLRRQNTVTFTGRDLTAADIAPDVLPVGNTVVIDDLQWAEGADVRRAILDLLRRTDMWVVLAGRSPVPEWLSPALHARALEVITEGDLTLTADNVKELFHLMGANLPESTIDRIIPTLSGSPVPVRLTAQAFSTGIPYNRAMYDKLVHDYWLYLDQHIYRSWPEELQDFMLRLSLLDRFTVPIARGLTGRDDAERLLRRAREIGNLFIPDPNGYAMRWQLLQSLRDRMQRTWTQEQKRALCIRAGEVYEQLGQLPEALAFYDRADDTGAISRLLIKNAARNIGVGFHYEMRHYYFKLPEKIIMASPELIAAMSIISSLMMDTESSEQWRSRLEDKVRTLTGAEQRRAASWAAYLDVALPHRSGEHVLPVLAQVARQIMNHEIFLPEFSLTSGLPSLMNGSKDFSAWCTRDYELAEHIGQPLSTITGRYGRGMVDLALAESQFEQGADMDTVLTLANSGLMAAQAGGKQELKFVGVAFIARVYCLRGRAADARAMLDQFGQELIGHRRIRCNLEALQARLDLYLGHPEEAAKWLRSMPPEGTEFNALDSYRYLTKVRLLIIQGRMEAALTLVQRLQWYAARMNRPYIQMECDLLASIIHYRLDDDRWRYEFDRSSRRAEKYRFVRLLSREGAALTPLLKQKPAPKDTDFFLQVWSEAEAMARRYPNYLNRAELDAPALDELSMKLLRLLADGLSRSRIAERTGLPERSVKYRTEQLYRTLGAAGKMEAVEKARKMGIL